MMTITSDSCSNQNRLAKVVTELQRLKDARNKEGQIRRRKDTSSLK
jgi:hypothetical protein